MPLEANTHSDPPPSREDIQYFQEALRIYQEAGLRELLELWTTVLADPETSVPERQRIHASVAVIAGSLTEVLQAVRARMRVLEEEGYGRGGAARARGGREE